MAFTRARRYVRRGISSVQAALILGLLTLAVFATVRLMGQSTSANLDRTATNVADPTTLVDRWGSPGDH